jgi:hypothetical protein
VCMPKVLAMLSSLLAVYSEGLPVAAV